MGESGEWTLGIRNAGERDLVVDGIGVSGDYYGINDGGGFTLAGDERRELQVRFAPGDSGLFAGSVTVYSNDPRGERAVSLRGEGWWPPEAALEPESIEFGAVTVGEDQSIINHGADIVHG